MNNDSTESPGRFSFCWGTVIRSSPIYMSDSLLNFYYSHKRMGEFVNYIEKGFQNKDDNIIVAQRAGSYYRSLILSTVVNNYHTFVEDLLIEIFRNKPDIVKSISGNINFKGVSTDTDVEKHIVQNILQKGIRSTDNKLQKYLNLKLFSHDTAKTIVIHAFDLRNLFTHQRGIIGGKFLLKRPEYDNDKGRIYDLHGALFANSVTEIIVSALNLDDQVAEIYGISRNHSPYEPIP